MTSKYQNSGPKMTVNWTGVVRFFTYTSLDVYTTKKQMILMHAVTYIQVCEWLALSCELCALCII